MKGTSSFSAKPGKMKYYGVAVGHVPGVYTDWASVQAQIKACKGANQKAFSTREEAQAYVDGFRRGSSAPISLRGDLSETSSLATRKMDKNVESAPKRQKKETAPPAPATMNGDVKMEPGMGLLPLDAVDGFDTGIKLDPDTGRIRIKSEAELNATKRQPTGDFSGPIVVYTDGSSLGNGGIGAVGGVGVYFGPNDLSRNVSEPLRGERQTNQRAELVAVARALDHIPIDRSTLIVTDSNYSIKCLEEWCIRWEKNGWKNAAGKSVENRDLVEPILARIKERKLCKADTKFEWIKGHSNHPGNVGADLLAVGGSRASTEERRRGHPRDDSETLRTPTRSKSLPKSKSPQRTKLEPDVDEYGEDAFQNYYAGLVAEFAGNKVQQNPLQDMAQSSIAAEQGAGAPINHAKESTNLVTDLEPPPWDVDAAGRTNLVQERTEDTAKAATKVEQE
ncbi:ribonuclease H-like protein [Decorospora gaudefroyi]|uniref:ribonuclease H n=1 Tax=Decorospora gaudefroyi TaxID=184978 RepID=A0A6A5K211_9PLEO|nr:ribonuclease H-like protein [Decorospora gaudefroyi]